MRSPSLFPTRLFFYTQLKIGGVMDACISFYAIHCILALNNQNWLNFTQDDLFNMFGDLAISLALRKAAISINNLITELTFAPNIKRVNRFMIGREIRLFIATIFLLPVNFLANFIAASIDSAPLLLR